MKKTKTNHIDRIKSRIRTLKRDVSEEIKSAITKEIAKKVIAVLFILASPVTLISGIRSICSLLDMPLEIDMVSVRSNRNNLTLTPTNFSYYKPIGTIGEEDSKEFKSYTYELSIEGHGDYDLAYVFCPDENEKYTPTKLKVASGILPTITQKLNPQPESLNIQASYFTTPENEYSHAYIALRDSYSKDYQYILLRINNANGSVTCYTDAEITGTSLYDQDIDFQHDDHYVVVNRERIRAEIDSIRASIH